MLMGLKIEDYRAEIDIIDGELVRLLNMRARLAVEIGVLKRCAALPLYYPDRERGVLIGATMVTPRAGEIVGELVLAIKLGTPLRTLADVIHPFPAFNRMLGESLNQLAAKVAAKGEHHEQYASQH
jgi:hypothetical protein